MTVAADGDLQFVLVGVSHHRYNVLHGTRPENGGGDAMKHLAFIGGNGSARCLIKEQRAIELRQVIKRARCVVLRDPRTLVGIETNNGSADGKLREMASRELVLHGDPLTRSK